MTQTTKPGNLIVQAWQQLVDEGKIRLTPEEPKFAVGSLVRLLGWSDRPWLVKEISSRLGTFVYEIQAVRAMRLNVIEVEERRIAAHVTDQSTLKSGGMTDKPQTTPFETGCKKGVRACNRPACPVCNPQTTETVDHQAFRREAEGLQRDFGIPRIQAENLSAIKFWQPPKEQSHDN